MADRGRTVQTRAVALAVLHVGLEERGDCLLVTSIRPQPKGYIRVRADGESIMAHRLVVEAREGRRLTAEEVVDHTCHNADPSCLGGNSCWHRRCIAVEHLEITDAVENWRRGRQSVQTERAARTHCPQGHEYTEANTGRANRKGGRRCRACNRARQAGRDPRLEPSY